ncbi:ATP-dependent zinc metalloprotease YME1 homolog isoform X2 [Copidosoma floridanum]|uniref:ATP-dependent zinc metalloprotease YME1 homolog isoform X2 n=1 Tax=Copidosoma floridanum TaxID=29053 RepID=UPI0006C96688|nr:ATP-dependent zinc metalloprotease YME1 homolog isoform X2 [Copidosoma floridanum]
MISLQSHNQVLYHLTQFTSVITPRSTVQVKKHNDSRHKKTEEILCKDSFFEAVKSCNELGMDKLYVHNLTSSLGCSRNSIWEMLEKISKKENLRVSQKNDKWRVSYVSGASFTENKRGFPNTQLLNDSMSTLYLYVKPQRRYYHKFHFLKSHPSMSQVRFFKTVRSVRAECDRNPTFSTRLKKWIGIKLQSDAKPVKLTSEELQTILTKDLSKLKNNQDEKYVKIEELHRIKTAFAEGYQAGHDHKPHGKAFKALKFTYHMISTLVLLSLLVVLMGGSMFKIQLGNRIQVDPEDINVTFNDVKGVEEAKTELMDIVEFLRNPDKFSALGGKLPKGVLLIGPPGTGKTLLARAVAGEAGVPFFHVAGPEFDEVLVGQGARRVRDLFKAAKERAPCVIFIDEIDSVGAKRTNSALHPYANQTINQLLTEMDGFHQNEGVIVLGATNRHQDLDKALLRPGRFDSEVTVRAPDYRGRKEIINLYLGRVLTRDIDSESLAKRTIGFTGADIENMINQAALRAAIEGAEFVTMDHIERARDKVIMGPEGKKDADEEANRITAYHEAGHALVAYFTKDATPLHKVTIIPRGQSMGHTSFIPNKDTNYTTKAQMLARMDASMGGRAAEELVFGLDKVTSGASSDFMHATQIAEAMVKKYGMSEKVGFRVYKERMEFGDDDGSYSSGTKEVIDNEVKRLLQESYDRAKSLLKNHNKEHKQLAEALLKYETLTADDVKTIVDGKKLRYETNDANRKIVDVPTNVM